MSLVTAFSLKTWMGIVTDTEADFLAMLAPAVDSAVKRYCKFDIEQTVYPGAAVGGMGDSGFYSTDGQRQLFLRQGPVNTVAFTGDTTLGSTTVAAVSGVAGLFVGQTVAGAGIPGGTTITAVGTTTLTLSQAATATGTAVALVGRIAVWLDVSGRFAENPDGSFAAATLLVEGTDYTISLDGTLPGTSTKCSYGGCLERLGGAWPRSVAYVAGRIMPVTLPTAGCLKVGYVGGYPTIPGDIIAAACQLAAVMRNQRQYGRGIQSEGYDSYAIAFATTVLNSAPELGSVRQLLAAYRRILV